MNQHDGRADPGDEGRLTNENLGSKWVEVMPAVLTYAMSAVSNYSDAREIVQTVALKLVEKQADYDPARPFLNWVLGITRYEIFNFRRRRARDKHVLGEQALQVIEGALAQRKQSSYAVSFALKQCLELLPEPARRVLKLRYFGELKPAAIARETDRTPAGVSMMLTRARRLLRDCVDRKLAEDPS